MRCIVRGFINGESKTLKEIGLENKKITKVYTILDEDNLYPKFDTSTGEKLDRSKMTMDDIYIHHLGNVFVEDQLHDWKVIGNIFSFHGHSRHKGDVHDLLVEYED